MGAIVVDDDDDVMLINSDGVIIRVPAREVSKLGRATQGVKIMNVGEDADIIAISKVARDDEDEEELKPSAKTKAKESTEAPDPQEEMKL